jgi:hypothetical protein
LAIQAEAFSMWSAQWASLNPEGTSAVYVAAFGLLGSAVRASDRGDDVAFGDLVVLLGHLSFSGSALALGVT